MDARIQAVLDRIHHHAAEPITIEALAREANLSRSRFTQLFRSATGTTPRQYVRRVRLERAHALLLGTTMTIREVMVAAGFKDPSHFTRDFGRCFGSSPQAFRMDNRQSAASSRPGGRVRC